MAREEFLNKLQLCYFGDKKAFNEIVEYVNELKNLYVKMICGKSF